LMALIQIFFQQIFLLTRVKCLFLKFFACTCNIKLRNFMTLNQVLDSHWFAATYQILSVSQRLLTKNRRSRRAKSSPFVNIISRANYW
jgi:hypothetical protein